MSWFFERFHEQDGVSIRRRHVAAQRFDFAALPRSHAVRVDTSLCQVTSHQLRVTALESHESRATASTPGAAA